MHQLNNHEGRRYNFDQCNFKATQYKNLILHKQSNHEEVRYLCGQCGFKGIDEASLGKDKSSYRRQLVEGLAGGGEGSPGVGQDPVHLLSHSLIESSYMCSKTRFNLIFSPGKDIWKVHITSLSNKAGNSNLEI